MRSFQQVIVLLFALFTFALAEESAYDATVYITSTVYRVNTVTLSGYGTSSLANSTTTISASAVNVQPSSYFPIPSSNGTTAAVYPTGTIAPSSTSPPPAFTGAASHLNVNAFVGALAAGMAFLAL
ncbi:hypothetical protein EJ04DRAFT_525255 [Polyplosphaeria fusca]|uniref:Uncharacterized protein n=1 Tax=Polyplosphaeria fusca TaxID=682080 RepID=A0A9P4QRP0_9PLEO|nr:hypothetical protein EJ04DRAFT_525255 [Polyplosphaeria fusca]